MSGSLDDIFSKAPQAEKKLEEKPAPKTEAKTAPKVESASLDDILSSDSDKVNTRDSNSEEETGVEALLSTEKLPVKPLRRDISFAEETGTQAKTIYVIYGDKGNGKTTLSFSFHGEKACLSYDRKALPIKTDMFDNDKSIHVFNAIGLMSYGDPKEFSFSSEETFNYSCALLDELKNKNYDWIIIDGTEILSRICEGAMRYRNNIAPFAGVKNRNLWKERRLYINQIHSKAVAAAKLGVIYTTYTDIEDIIEEGETVSKKKIPAWIDVVMTESDIVIYTELKLERGIAKYQATVNSSKRKYMRSGVTVDISGITGFDAIVEASKRR